MRKICPFCNAECVCLGYQDCEDISTGKCDVEPESVPPKKRKPDWDLVGKVATIAISPYVSVQGTIVLGSRCSNGRTWVKIKLADGSFTGIYVEGWAVQ